MGVYGNVCCVVVVVKDSIFLPWSIEVCLCKGYCVFCLCCEAWICRYSCMGGISVSSCRCCMFVSCVHPVAVLNAAFCFRSKVRPRTFGWLAIGSAVLFILRSRLLLYFAGSGVNKVQVVLSGFSV